MVYINGLSQCDPLDRNGPMPSTLELDLPHCYDLSGTDSMSADSIFYTDSQQRIISGPGNLSTMNTSLRAMREELDTEHLMSAEASLPLYDISSLLEGGAGNHIFPSDPAAVNSSDFDNFTGYQPSPDHQFTASFWEAEWDGIL